MWNRRSLFQKRSNEEARLVRGSTEGPVADRLACTETREGYSGGGELLLEE